MLARLVSKVAAQRGTPVAAVLGDGNALPLADGVADLVTYAQSWHWLDPATSISEARRVLRPGARSRAAGTSTTRRRPTGWQRTRPGWRRRCPPTGARRWRSGRCRPSPRPSR
ncbi:class I SAM-dependent methyltransferase [Nonomuraea antimicrobica]